MVYKNYPYSVIATAISALSSCFSFVLMLAAIYCLISLESIPVKLITVILLIAASVFFFVYMSRTLPDKVAEKDFSKKIKTSVNVAYLFCRDHPEHFDEVAADNSAFAEKYHLDENNKLVKNK